MHEGRKYPYVQFFVSIKTPCLLGSQRVAHNGPAV
jgi:hypothetical protein